MVFSVEPARRILLGAMVLSTVCVVAAGCRDVGIYPLRRDLPDAGTLQDAGGEQQDAGPSVEVGVDVGVPVTCPWSMFGFATVRGRDGSEITGGTGGRQVVATTAAELTAYAAMDVPLVIQIRGLLTASAAVRFASDKTIYGDPETPGSGLTGAGLNFTDASNIIVRNIQISKAIADEGDAITLLRSQHVWIDHCELSSEAAGGNYDGLIDITHASDFITVSWTYFHDHRDTSLVGHSENNMAEDTGHLTVSYHHNWFRGVYSGPRVRFGTAHVYNNVFDNIAETGSFGVASESYASVLVEQNHFVNVTQPITTMFKDAVGGTAWDRKNNYVGSGANNIAPTTLPVLVPPYNYDADSTDTVMGIVPACAGTGKIDDPLRWF